MAGEIKLNDVSVATESGGTVTIAPNNVTFAANHAGIKAALNASGNPGIYACRAWVNFDGTLDENQLSLTTGENVYIRDAGNVSSVSYNGTGDYSITMTTAMPDTNYSISGASGLNSANAQTFFQMEQQSFGSTSVIDIAIRNESGSRINSVTVSVQVFR